MTHASYRSSLRTLRAIAGVALVTAFTAQCSSNIQKPPGLRTTTVAGHVAAELGEPQAKTAIVMVHGRSTHKDSWYPMMPKLAAAGYRTIAYDYDSSAEAEIATVVKQVRAEGAEHIVLMGSSLGAGHALRASNDCVVAADATITFSAVEVVASPFQPVLAIASEKDGDTTANARAIAKNQGLRSQALIIKGATHGVDLVNNHPEAIDAVVRWLADLPRLRPGPVRQPGCVESIG